MPLFKRKITANDDPTSMKSLRASEAMVWRPSIYTLVCIALSSAIQITQLWSPLAAGTAFTLIMASASWYEAHRIRKRTADLLAAAEGYTLDEFCKTDLTLLDEDHADALLTDRIIFFARFLSVPTDDPLAADTTIQASSSNTYDDLLLTTITFARNFRRKTAIAMGGCLGAVIPIMNSYGATPLTITCTGILIGIAGMICISYIHAILTHKRVAKWQPATEPPLRTDHATP